MPDSAPLQRNLTAAICLAVAFQSVGAQAPVDSLTTATLHSYVTLHPRVAETSGIVLGALTLSLFDNRIAHEVHEFRVGSGSGMSHASLVTSSVGGYLPLAAGGTLAVTGWAFHNDFTKHLGADVTKAVVESGLITTAIKGAVGRSRPRAFPTDPDKYSPGRGFFNNDRASFPSGHTSAAFAGATVLATELARAHPTHSRWVTFGLYGAATVVGFSRMYENAHWASDVFAGAAIGTLSGLHVAHQRDKKQ